MIYRPTGRIRRGGHFREIRHDLASAGCVGWIGDVGSVVVVVVVFEGVAVKAEREAQ